MSTLMRLLCFTAIVGPAASVGKIYAFHIVLAAALCTIAPVELFSARRALRTLPSRYHHLFPLMIAWFALGLLWSWDRHDTVMYIVYLLVGSSLAMLVVMYVKSDVRKFESLLGATAIALGIDAAVGLLEALTDFRLPVSPYAADSAVLDVFSLDDIERLSSCPTGFQWNPNHYAVGISLAVPFILFHQRTWLRMAGLLVSSVLIFQSGSRACMVALALAIVAAPLFRRARGGRYLLPVACIGALSFLLISGTMFRNSDISQENIGKTLGTIDAIKRLFSGEGNEGDSIDIRRNLVLNAFEALKETKGLGVGGGGDAYVQRRFGGVRDIQSTHNIWVELLVNGGFIFFVPFAIWYASLAGELRRWHLRAKANRKLAYYCSALSLALIMFVFSAISASTVIYFLPMYLLFGFSIAMVNVCRHAARCAQRAPRPAWQLRQAQCAA